MIIISILFYNVFFTLFKYYENDQGMLHSNKYSIFIIARCGFGWWDSLSIGYWTFFCGHKVLQEKVWGRSFCTVNDTFHVINFKFHNRYAFLRFWWIVIAFSRKSYYLPFFPDGCWSLSCGLWHSCGRTDSFTSNHHDQQRSSRHSLHADTRLHRSPSANLQQHTGE